MEYWCSLQLLSVCLSVCLSVHPISPSLYTLLTSNHHCIFTMPNTCTSHYYFGSPTVDLGAVTFPLTFLVTTKLLERNITFAHFANISGGLKESDLGWPLTHFLRSDRSSQPWTLLVSAILPQQNITSMPKWYIWWVLPISQLSSDLWPTFQG